MAEELGAGYISLLPSMRGFSAAVKKELKKALASVRGEGVEIPVTPKFDQKLLDESLKAQRRPLRVPVVLEPLHDKVRGDAGKVRVPVEIDRDSYFGSLDRVVRDRRATVHQKVKIEVDRDKTGNLFNNATDSASKAGTSIGNALLSPISGIFSSPISGLPAIILTAVAAAFAALPAAIIAGVAATAAVLAGAGLGGILVGAILLSGDAEVKKAFGGLATQVKTTLTDAVKPLKGPFLEAIGILGKSFKDATPGIKDFFKELAKSGAIQELARGLGGALKQLSDTGALKKLGEAVGPILKQLGMALPDIGNAISQLLISLSNAAPQAADFFGKLLRFAADVIRIVGGVIGWLAKRWDTLKSVVRTVFTVISDIWSGLKILGNAVVGAITANMDKVKPLADLLKRIFGDLTGKITDIPKKITAALSGAKTLLLDSGKAVVQGLIDGIKAKLGPLGNVMSAVAGLIYNYLQHSPAKYGPLSGRGNTYYSGQEIATALAAGVDSKLPTVATAAGQLAGTFSPASTLSAASAAQQPTVRFAGPDAILELLRKLVENEGGGNVQFAFGRG